jgi:hypothetical protein
MHEVRRLLEATASVAEVLDDEGKREAHLDHPRAGELVAIAEPDAWFTYYYWLDDRLAPDYARTVDIHRKPGYDPVELFLDPHLKAPKVKVGWTLLKAHLGFRYLMDVIRLDASLVRGSHEHVNASPEDSPLCMTQEPGLLDATVVDAAHVHELILRHLTWNGRG